MIAQQQYRLVAFPFSHLSLLGTKLLKVEQTSSMDVIVEKIKLAREEKLNARSTSREKD